MPEKRCHRGPHPEDAKLFAPPAWASLRQAVADLSWLLSHGYATVSATKLVGDRYALTDRQRIAVQRSACSDQALERRRAHETPAVELAGQGVLIDGFNIITTVEAALGHGVLLRARDGCLRDMASMHGSYRKVQETPPAIKLIGKTLASLGAVARTWLLDSPVSNSGRLKTIIRAVASEHGWNWQVEVVQNPDAVLIQAPSPQIAATADSVILDRCDRWVNLSGAVLRQWMPETPIVDLSIA